MLRCTGSLIRINNLRFFEKKEKESTEVLKRLLNLVQKDYNNQKKLDMLVDDLKAITYKLEINKTEYTRNLSLNENLVASKTDSNIV